MFGDTRISIEVSLHRLSALGLTLTDIANTIRRSSLELSSGSIDTRESQVRVRTLGQNYDQQDFEERSSCSAGVTERLFALEMSLGFEMIFKNPT